MGVGYSTYKGSGYATNSLVKSEITSYNNLRPSRQRQGLQRRGELL